MFASSAKPTFVGPATMQVKGCSKSAMFFATNAFRSFIVAKLNLLTTAIHTITLCTVNAQQRKNALTAKFQSDIVHGHCCGRLHSGQITFPTWAVGSINMIGNSRVTLCFLKDFDIY